MGRTMLILGASKKLLSAAELKYVYFLLCFMGIAKYCKSIWAYISIFTKHLWYFQVKVLEGSFTPE